MNREIKFRAWHTIQNEWWYFTLDEVINGGNKQEIWRHSANLINRTAFTGLKDKNRVEIYEGDRVRRRTHLTDGKDYIDWNCDVNFNGWCYGLFVADKQLWGLDPITARELEIIGNIYQSPELLTTQQ